MASSDPIEPGPRVAPSGDRTWQAQQREIAESNAEVQRAGRKQREAREQEQAARRRAAADAETPDGRWR
jgi:hypothetical protein